MDGEKLRRRFKKRYKYGSEYIAGLSVMALVIAIVMDILPFPYFLPCLETFFTYNVDAVIAIVLVIWTFTTALIIFCMGRLGEQYYGIRMLEILLAGVPFARLYIQCGIFLSELLILIIAVIVEFEITIVVLAGLQFMAMIFVFHMVCIENSKNTVLDRIKEDIENKKRLAENTGPLSADICKRMLFVRMINNLNYRNLDELEELTDILKEKMLRADNDKVGRWLGRQFSSYILEAGKKSKNVFLILQTWTASPGCSEHVKKGVLEALVQDGTDEAITLCQKILKMEKDRPDTLYIWCIAVNIFMSSFHGEEWRIFYNARLETVQEHIWDDRDNVCAMNYWKEISEDFQIKNDGEYHKLLAFLYDRRRRRV